jgi:hypothetical protein
MAEVNPPNPVAGGSGTGRVVQNQNVVIDPAAQNAAAQLGQQILANTNVTLKQEIIKIPEYYGEKGRDTVTAQEFISRIDECQVSNDWNDTTTFTNFRLCLRVETEEWLSSTVRHLKLTMAQKTWTHIRPLFKREFATTSDDKLIVDGLANLAHKQGENPRKFFSRLEKLSTSSMKTTHPTGSSQNAQLNFRLATTQRMRSLNMPMIMLRHTINSFWPKYLRQQLWKTFASCCRTRTKLASPWMMPTKRSSQNTGWNKTRASPPLVSMPWKKIRIRMLLFRILMWLLSGHNSSNSAHSSPDIITVGIAPGDKAPTEATPTTGQCRTKAQMQQEMVNSVFTAKF